jgi:hypothetical protein
MKLKRNRQTIGFSVGLIVLVGGLVATRTTTKTAPGTTTANALSQSEIAAATTAAPPGMRPVVETKTKLVNYTVKMPVRENHTKEIQYTVLKPVYETREKTITYTVCTMVPEVRTKTLNYTTCRMEEETRQKSVEYKEVRFEPIDDQPSNAK